MQKFGYGTVGHFRILFGTVRFGSGREKSSRVSLYNFEYETFIITHKYRKKCQIRMVRK